MKKTMIILMLFSSALVVLPGEAVAKRIFLRAGREAAEQVGRRASTRTLTRLTAESPEAVARLTARYGDNGLRVVSQHGRPAMRALLEASDDAGPVVLRMIQRHGDDAVRMAQSPAGRRILATESDTMMRAMFKTRDLGYPVLRQHGTRGARAIDALSPAQSRQLIRLHREGRFTAAQFDELCSVIARYGDAAMRFIWKHKGALTVGTVLTAFLKDPEPFIGGAKDVAGLATEQTGELAQTVASSFMEQINWNLWVGVLVIFLGVRRAWRKWREKRREQVDEAPSAQPVAEEYSI